jgi:hypothetical protein
MPNPFQTAARLSYCCLALKFYTTRSKSESIASDLVKRNRAERIRELCRELRDLGPYKQLDLPWGDW